MKKFCTKEKAASHQGVNGIQRESKLTTFYPHSFQGIKIGKWSFPKFPGFGFKLGMNK